MTCFKVKYGYVCGPDKIIDLSPLGAKVWMEWHNYLGPIFYRSKNMIKPIGTPSKKTWEAFERWRECQELV